jgi:hypothetical protein
MLLRSSPTKNTESESEKIKEKRKTIDWTMERQLLAHKKLIRVGGHLPGKLTFKRVSAATSCMLDPLFKDGLELSGKNLGDQFLKWVSIWKAKFLDPRHNKSGMDGDRHTNMTVFEIDMEDVVKAMDAADEDSTNVAKVALS